jgi:hypothetical protein
LVAVQVTFWTMTQPMNKYWMQDTEHSRTATRFFETGTAVPVGDWMEMPRAIASVLGLLLVYCRGRERF